MSQIEEEEKVAENKRKEVAASEMEEKRKKMLEKESFLNDLEKGDRPLDEIVSEHSSKMTKKQSVLFSSVKVHIQANELHLYQLCFSHDDFIIAKSRECSSTINKCSIIHLYCTS